MKSAGGGIKRRKSVGQRSLEWQYLSLSLESRLMFKLHLFQVCRVYRSLENVYICRFRIVPRLGEG